jgi:hypothetical protein
MIAEMRIENNKKWYNTGGLRILTSKNYDMN